MKTVDVLIIGGGIIGCSIALELLRTQVQVLLLEKDRIGCEASGEAAGMLAPITGRLMAELLRDEQPSFSLAPFRLDR